MNVRSRAVLLIDIAVLVFSAGAAVAAVGPRAPSHSVRASHASGEYSLVEQARTGASRQIRTMMLAQGADQPTPPSADGADKLSPEQRSKKLRAEIRTMILDPEALQEDIGERKKRILTQRTVVSEKKKELAEAEKEARARPEAEGLEQRQLRTMREDGSVEALEEKEKALKEAQELLQKLEDEQAEAKSAKAKIEAPQAVRSLAPEVTVPSTFDEAMEAQKDRAFQSYESEKASGNLRDLLDTISP